MNILKNSKDSLELSKFSLFKYSRSKPEIFWMPAKFSEESVKKFKASQERLEKELTAFRDDAQAKLE